MTDRCSLLQVNHRKSFSEGTTSHLQSLYSTPSQAVLSSHYREADEAGLLCCASGPPSASHTPRTLLRLHHPSSFARPHVTIHHSQAHTDAPQRRSSHSSPPSSAPYLHHLHFSPLQVSLNSLSSPLLVFLSALSSSSSQARRLATSAIPPALAQSTPMPPQMGVKTAPAERKLPAKADTREEKADGDVRRERYDEDVRPATQSGEGQRHEAKGGVKRRASSSPPDSSVPRNRRGRKPDARNWTSEEVTGQRSTPQHTRSHSGHICLHSPSHCLLCVCCCARSHPRCAGRSPMGVVTAAVAGGGRRGHKKAADSQSVRWGEGQAEARQRTPTVEGEARRASPIECDEGHPIVQRGAR